MVKFLPLDQAVAENLHDGDTVAFEGFTHLIPTQPGTKRSARDFATCI